MKHLLRIAMIAALAALMTTLGCQRTYYGFWEKLGKEKRHLLKDRVEDVRDEQEKTQEEFKEVLARVKEIYGFEGGKLEDFYDRLKDDYEDCELRAEAVRERIDEVESVAEALFREWEAEINEINNMEYREKSRRSLNDTRARYARLQATMEQAESRMAPVLQNLKDYTLFLKHNLNARAIGALGQEVDSIEIKVQSLIRDIRRSINEADDFLKDFE